MNSRSRDHFLDMYFLTVGSQSGAKDVSDHNGCVLAVTHCTQKSFYCHLPILIEKIRYKHRLEEVPFQARLIIEKAEVILVG